MKRGYKIMLCFLGSFWVIESFAQVQDSIPLSIDGQVIEAYLGSPVKNPQVSIYLYGGGMLQVKGDSLGAIHWNGYIARNTSRLKVEITAAGPYQKSYLEFTRPEQKDSFAIRQNFELLPSFICVDTWILPDLLFDKHDSIYQAFLHFTDGDSISTDSALAQWIHRFTQAPIDTNLGISMLAFADYEESDLISQRRLDFVYRKLQELGLPKSKLHRVNKNKAPRKYYKYRDGCHPYYLIENQPLLIDKTLIETCSPAERPAYQNLRRVVSFNWKASI